MALALVFALASGQRALARDGSRSGSRDGAQTVTAPNELTAVHPEADPFDAATIGPARAEIRRFLRALPVVRVFFAIGRGFGHQAAGVRLIRRLRELGFDGRVEAVYDGRIASKLAVLLPGFDPSLTQSQLVSPPGLGSIQTIPLSAVEAQPLPPARFGAIGASDGIPGERLREILNVDALALLQPRWWEPFADHWDGMPPEMSMRELRLRGGGAVSLQHLLPFGPALEPAAIRDWPAFIREEAGSSPAAAFLAALGSRLGGGFGSVDLMPTYGLDNPAYDDIVKNDAVGAHAIGLYVGALREAQREHPELFQKPIVLVDFSRFERPAALAAFREALSALRVPFYEAADGTHALHVESEAGSIAVVHVGAAPPRALEEVFRRATLPALCQGKNLIDLMLSAGRPFLLPIRDTGEMQREMAALHLTNEARELIGGAIAAGHTQGSYWGFLFPGKRMRQVARYIVDSRRPDGVVQSVARALSIHGEVAAFNHDLVGRAVLEASAALNRADYASSRSPRFAARHAPLECRVFQAGS